MGSGGSPRAPTRGGEPPLDSPREEEEMGSGGSPQAPTRGGEPPLDSPVAGASPSRAMYSRGDLMLENR